MNTNLLLAAYSCENGSPKFSTKELLAKRKLPLKIIQTQGLLTILDWDDTLFPYVGDIGMPFPTLFELLANQLLTFDIIIMDE